MTDVYAILHQIERNNWLATAVPGGWCLTCKEEEVFMSLMANWLCFALPLEKGYSIPPTVDPEKRVALYRSLLEQSERMFMAKYALDGRTPLLMAEVGKKMANELMLNRALGALSHYHSSKEKATDQGQLVHVVRTTRVTKRQANTVSDNSLDETLKRSIINLSSDGWVIKDFPRGNRWHLGYKAKTTQRVFDAYLSLTKMWAYFQVPILAESTAPVLVDGNPEAQALFLEYLLQLNAAWFMAKIGIGDEDQVLLQVEIPIEALQFPVLQFVTRTIATYLEHYGQEISIMALLQNDPRLSEMLQMASYR